MKIPWGKILETLKKEAIQMAKNVVKTVFKDAIAKNISVKKAPR